MVIFLVVVFAVESSPTYRELRFSPGILPPEFVLERIPCKLNSCGRIRIYESCVGSASTKREEDDDFTDHLVILRRSKKNSSRENE